MTAPLRKVTGGRWLTRRDVPVNEAIARVIEDDMPGRGMRVESEWLECGHRMRHDPPRIDVPGRRRSRRCRECARAARAAELRSYQEARHEELRRMR